MRRHLFTLGLLGYVGVLVLASWPEPLRPALFDGAHALAKRVLRIPGWTAGQNVFQIPDYLEEAPRAYCTYVKATAPGRELQLQPKAGHCADTGVRWHTPGREIFEARSLVLARIHRSAHPGGSFHENEVLGALGRYHCRGARAEGFPAERVVVVQYALMGSYTDGSVRRAPLLVYDWGCDTDRASNATFGPAESTLLRLWGSGRPWP